jgi:DNA excision repair protein ERCC-2
MTIRIENKNIFLSVRDLIRYNPNPRKVLSSFPLPQRGLLGKQAQTKLQESKNTSYGLFHKEISISHEFRHRKFRINLQGRIDGIYELPKRIEVEEIKSVILSNNDFKNLEISSFPEYTEQISIYCYLLYIEQKQQNLLPIVTLINLVNDKSRSFKLEFNPDLVEKLILQRFDQIIDTIGKNEKKQKIRLKQLAKVNFSLPEKRKEQDEIMTAVASSLQNGEHHMITAPTGTGKTAAVLFPSIIFAVNHQKRIMYITSKTTQQQIIRKTLNPIIENGLDLSVCFLRSSKQMCANDIVFCHEDYCPYIKNYQDESIKSRLFKKLHMEQILDPEIIFAYSKAEKICPAEIMFDLAATCDVLIGDYNYIFDPRVQLKRLFQRNDLSEWILIIDEAHNLYQRTIDTLSPELNRSALINLSKALLNDKLKVYGELKKSLSGLEVLFQSLQSEGETHHSEQRYFTCDLDLPSWQKVFSEYEVAFIKYLIFKIRKNMLVLEDPFEQFYYQFRGFIQIAGMQNDTFISFYDAAQKGRIKIECCDPSKHISDLIQKFHSVIAMSATLDPINYYQEVLGFPSGSTRLQEVSSPFSTNNRQVIIYPMISTYYRDRANLYQRYADIVKDVILVKDGKYIVFCPSFEFIQNLYLYLGSVKSTIIAQRRQMTEEDRGYIISQFRDTEKSKILLAVMGGIFAEGVDFRGDMCIGVIVFSPALPKITFERELIREYYDQRNDNGFNYAYLYPGINKVIQSVGRLIRSQQDKGIIVLAGERFAQDEINQLFPDYWFEKEGDVVITDKLKETVSAFWKRFES